MNRLIFFVFAFILSGPSLSLAKPFSVNQECTSFDRPVRSHELNRVLNDPAMITALTKVASGLLLKSSYSIRALILNAHGQLNDTPIEALQRASLYLWREINLFYEQVLEHILLNHYVIIPELDNFSKNKLYSFAKEHQAFGFFKFGRPLASTEDCYGIFQSFKKLTIEQMLEPQRLHAIKATFYNAYLDFLGINDPRFLEPIPHKSAPYDTDLAFNLKVIFPRKLYEQSVAMLKADRAEFSRPEWTTQLIYEEIREIFENLDETAQEVLNPLGRNQDLEEAAINNSSKLLKKFLDKLEIYARKAQRSAEDEKKQKARAMKYYTKIITEFQESYERMFDTDVQAVKVFEEKKKMEHAKKLKEEAFLNKENKRKKKRIEKIKKPRRSCDGLRDFFIKRKHNCECTRNGTRKPIDVNGYELQPGEQICFQEI